MEIIVILILVIALFYYLKTKKKQTATDIKYQEKSSGVGEYVRELKRIDLKGVNNYINSDDWKKINSFDIVNVKFDEKNKYDKNAIGVYTQNGKLLGYLPRNQRKIIKTLRENETCLAVIVSKTTHNALKDPKHESYYSIRIDLWLGFPEDELEQEKNKRLGSKY